MKKFCSILVVIFALCMGVIFSACKDNYKFDMKFYLNDRVVSEVNLYIDENGETKPQAMRVEFSKIKAGKIAPVELTINQSGVAKITDEALNGKTYSFNITALAPNKQAKLTIRHLSSNKTASVTLNIHKRSSKITNLNKTYVLGIPTEQTISITIDAKQLLDFDGTEDVYYKLASNSSLPAGVEMQTKEIDNKSYISAFNISSTVENGASVQVNPVFSIPNYYTRELDETITIQFVRLIDANDINLEINNYNIQHQNNSYQSDYEAGKPIVLLNNDDDYKRLKLGVSIGETDADKQLYKALYVQPEFDENASFNFSKLGEDFIIKAISYANNQQIDLHFEPNANYVGEIAPVNKSIILSSYSRALDLDVKLEDTKLNDLSNITIYDTYFNQAGGKFNFVPQTNAVAGMEQFNFMRFVVPSYCLDANLADDGIHQVFNTHAYNNDGSELFTDQILSKQGNIKTNNYLLQIFKDNQPLKFWYDNNTSSFVSESFKATDDVFIRYTENEQSSLQEKCSLKVETFFKPNGENLYFETATALPQNKTLTFNVEYGITDFDLVAGDVDSQNRFNYLNSNDSHIKAEHVAINKADEHKYVLNIDKVFGKFVDGQAQLVGNSQFDLSITANDNQTNLVQIGVSNADYNFNPSLTVTNLTYNSTSTSNSLIYLSFANADLGNYTLKISHNSGLKKLIPIFIYQNAEVGDFGDLKFTNNSEYILNKNADGRLYNEIDADYIVPADENNSIVVYVDNLSKFNLTYNNQTSQKFYNFSLSRDMKYFNNDASKTDRAAEDFSSYTMFDNDFMADNNIAFGAYLTFTTNKKDKPEAGYFEGGKNYVLVNFELANKYSFDNILAVPTLNESNKVTKTISFYIYKKLNKSDLEITSSNSNIYYNNYLALNFEEESKTSLNLTCVSNEDIWYYLDSVTWQQTADLNLELDNLGSYYTQTDTTIINDFATGLDLQFLKQPYLGAYYVFSATLTQFGTPITIYKRVDVSVPVVTNSISVDGVSYDLNGNPYLDLQLDVIGQDGYTLNYKQMSTGEITHLGVSLYVLTYSEISGNYTIATNNENISFNANKILVSGAGKNVKLLVVASDVIKSKLEANYANITDFTQKFINPNELDYAKLQNNSYLGAYKIVDLYITNGDQTNPIIIDSADDFANLENYADTSDKWFVITRDINLQSLSKPITKFGGHITTLQNEIVNLDVSLNNSMPNLFTQVLGGGTIKNLSFNVNYNYNFNSANLISTNLGVIGQNAGDLNCVYVTFGGNASITTQDSINFGGLVGYNSGNINYETGHSTRAEILKASRSAVINLSTFHLSGAAKVYFGGLVGHNAGNIYGAEISGLTNASNKRIEFANNVSSGATAQIDINSTLEGEGALGGFVGLNAGKISKVLVRGNLVGGDNLGGIIGKNSTSTANAEINYSEDTINGVTLVEKANFDVVDCISQVTISGKNNVGGLVGYDTNGKYYNCAYQIYQPTTAILGVSKVGGLAGYSLDGWFNLCYVFSYKWDYSNLATIDENGLYSADIVGENYVAGLVGEAGSSWSDTTQRSTKSVAVVASSVNAYLKATIGENNSLSGILNVSEANPSEIQLSAIYNAYFIGKLDGNYLANSSKKGLVLSNKSEGNHLAAYGNVYSVIYGENANVEASYNSFDLKNVSSGGMNVWAKNDELNGGYIYLVKDGAPLFELSPTNITATLSENKNVRGAYKIDDDTLFLSYYNFNLDITKPDYQTKFKVLQKFNTYPILSEGDDILGLMDFNWQPDEIKTLRLTTKSSNGFLQIVDGNLVVSGVGTTSIEFSSILNPNKKVSITVVVGYPFGTQFSLRENLTSLANLGELSTFGIGVGKTREIAANFAGRVNLDIANNETYNYTVSNQIKYKVSAQFSDTDKQQDFEDFITNQITIGGQKFSKNKDEYSVTANNLTISVFERFDGIITFKVLPILDVNSFGANLATITDENLAVTFNFTTLAGATKVEMQSRGGVVYPNTSMEADNSFNVDITTDFAYSETDLDFTSIDAKLQIKVYIDGDLITLPENKNLTDIIDFSLVSGNKKITYNSLTQKQTLSFNIKFDTLSNMTDNSKPHKIRFEFIVNKNTEYMVYNYTTFDLLPQQINSVNIRNYKYNPNQENKIEESSYLYPSTSSSASYGLIIIDMYPLNGYFDYLEIRDLTNASSRVNFVQVDSNFRRVGLDTPTDDGIGIRLVKIENADNSKIYALTQISSNAEEITHSIEVRAYASTTGAATLLNSSILQVQIRLQPEVIVDYLTPNRTTFDTAVNNEAHRKNEMAYGVDAEFRLTTQNLSSLQQSLSFVDASLNIAEYFNLQALSNGYYRLVCLKQSTDLIGKSVHVGFTGIRVLNTGEEISTTTGYDLTITWFMVYGVSVTNSRIIGQSRQIVGNLDQPIDFEFYFASGDVSYYLNKGVSYHYTDQPRDEGEQKIVNILKILNGQKVEGDSIDINNLLTWYTDDGVVAEENLFDMGITLNRDITPPQMIVENNNIKYVELQFKLEEQNHYKIVQVLGEEEQGFKYKYELNFVRQTPVFDAELIESESKFYTMSGAGTRYILGKDLEFNSNNPYVPFSLDVAEFDGNGHTITISAFADFEGTQINAGLFTSIAQTCVVKNLQVNYQLGNITAGNRMFSADQTYMLGGENSLYDKINFGGIAAENNGVITNCKVTGRAVFKQTNINLSAISQQAGENISLFDFGGLVYQNTSTAYITNCVCDLKISAMANIGGLVHTNMGKISSSYFDAVNGLMYVYLTYPLTDPNKGNLTYDLDAHSAGFVYQNSGTIDMCYVVSGQTSNQANSYLGNLAAKNNYAGFVYTNTGNILNSYTDILLINLNLSIFSAFANSSSGSIINCYTYINSGKQLPNNQFTFAPDGNLLGVIKNCYTIVYGNALINNDDKITKIKLDDILNKSNAEIQEKFIGFTFGDNASAVWQLNNADELKLPKLSAVLETIEFGDDFANNPSYNTTYQVDGVDKKVTRYYGWRDVVVFDDGSHQIIVKTDGTKQNPYVLYNAETFNAYFENDKFLNGYYRLVKDIDFNLSTPYTSKIKFAGNIQGNGLTISNFRLNTDKALTAIGLFSELDGESSDYQNNTIRNLVIKQADISAIKTQAVGGLSGIVTNYHLYNITIDSNYIILGENAVGGLAGLVQGKFDIQTISSNASCHIDYEYTSGDYQIYQSKLNNATSNLNLVHYSGSVVGILDAYTDTSINITTRNITSGNRVEDIVVDGQILQISGTVGGAFGLVNEYTNVNNVSVSITAAEEQTNLNKLSGYQYSGGVAGENRGVITNATFTTNVTTIFNASRAVSAGLVALNMGYIGDSTAKFDAIRNDTNLNYSNSSILAGLVGRDVNGYLQDCSFDGQILSYRSNATEITAGAIGTRYTAEKMVGGAVSQLAKECMDNVLTDFEYEGVENHITNVTISANAINFWLENLNNIYTIRNGDVSFVLEGGRVLAAGVGLQTQDYVDLNYAFDNDGNFVVNGSSSNKAVLGMFTDTTMFDGNQYNTPYANVFRHGVPVQNQVYVLYAIGSYVEEFDIWTRANYSGEMMLLADNIDSVSKLFVNKDVETDEDLGSAARIKTLNSTLSTNNTITYTIFVDNLQETTNTFAVGKNDLINGTELFYIVNDGELSAEVQEVQISRNNYYKLSFSKGDIVRIKVNANYSLDFNFVGV